MRIEHSKLLNQFISFWFETKVEGVLKFETDLDFVNHEWHTCRTDESGILLRGKWDAQLPDNGVIDYVAPFVESAIKEGRI